MTDFKKNAGNSVKFVEIDAERAGQRIDNFLLSYLKGVPKTLIYKILRKGEVRVNKGRVKAPYRLQEGDVVRIPPVRVSESAEVAPSKGVLARIEASLIFENEGLIIINKPSGIAVHGGSGVSYGVIEAIRKLRPEERNLELAHRLDRETSGCLVITKKRSALRQMHELLRSGQIEKRYLALCQGKWRGDGKLIDAPLRKNVVSSGERIVKVSPDGKEAQSRFTPQQRFKQATLMDVELLTGRTHQIRVHAQYSDHPLAGDEKYGDKTFNQQMKALGLKRLFLHAYKLRFPWGEGEITVEAPLSSELDAFLQRLV